MQVTRIIVDLAKNSFRWTGSMLEQSDEIGKAPSLPRHLLPGADSDLTNFTSAEYSHAAKAAAERPGGHGVG